MKKSILLFCLLTFIVGLSVGYQMGPHIISVSARQQKINQWPYPNQSIPTLNNGQRSILIICVDRMNVPRPQLECLWLLTYLPSTLHPTWLPIYPSTAQPASETNTTLIPSFSLVIEPGAVRPTATFLQALKDKNLWWSGYVVLDEYALATIVDHLGGKATRLGSDGKRVTENIPRAADDPEAALFHQVMLLQDLCWNTWQQESISEISSLLQLIPKHISTDLDTHTLSSELNTFLAYKDEVSCEIPTISAKP